MKIRRQLAEQQPAAYLPNLATSLNNLANTLSEQGDAESRKEALTCAREAVKIRRQLGEQQPAAYLPDLAASLNNLANTLSAQGDAASRQEALTCAREAVKIYAVFHAQMPAAFERNLGIAARSYFKLAESMGMSREAALAALDSKDSLDF